MPLSFKQAGSLFVAGPNISIFPSGNTYAISGSPSSAGVGYGVTGVTSAGTGQYLFLSGTIVNNNLIQKSISAGTGIAISEDAITLTFRATGSSVGSAVTGLTSAGTGNRLIFSSLTNNNTVLVQKSLSGGTGIAIIDSGTGTLTFSSTSTSNGTIISGTNAGTGVPIFSAASGSNLVFRRILSGSNIGVFLSGNDIVISGTSGAINGITGITNVGTGSILLSSVTSGSLIARTISGSNGIEVVESGNNILVRPVNTTANRLFIAGTGGLLTTDDEFQINTTNGTMSIGFNSEQSNVTSRLLLAAGTAAISQIRLTAFAAAYTSTTTTGDIWYNSTSGNSLFFNKSANAPTPFIFKDNNYSLTGATNNRVLQTDTTGTINAINYITSLGIFNIITSTTISGTSELSTINSDGTFINGTTILNSSSHGTTPQLITGKKFRFNAKGLITTTVTSAGNLIAKIKLGSILVASSTTALQTSISSKYFEIDSTFTIRSQGASGKVIGSGKMLTDNQYLNSALSQIVSITSLGEVTIDTTTDKIFDLTLQNDTNANNIYIINEATLEYLN
jgi:hypothetical protein